MEFKHPIDRVQLRAYIQQFEENGGDLNDLCKPDQYPDLNNLLGSDGIARLQTFEKKAVEDLYSNRDCDKPYSNGVSMERTTADNIVVFFDCNNGNRFYISELELK